ncbi:MAG: ParA family protein [Bacilli bacterium]|jgi:chromosome partitioning protein|nr:ParA family protein [Erysipelotrichia bacterium]
MAKIIGIVNQKGGVGKTTTAINLSSALAHFRRKVLLIDLDPQSDATRGLGFDPALQPKTIYDVLVKNYDLNRVIKKTVVKHLELVPSNLKLASIDSAIEEKVVDKLSLLKETLLTLKKDYDYIIIDCPPSLGTLNYNSLVAANSVLIPVQCEYFALEAVSPTLVAISNTQKSSNPHLEIEGFLLTMYDARTRLGIEISQEIRGLFKENTFLTTIPRNISIPEASFRGVPVTIFRPSASGSLAYFSLAREVIDKEESN